MNFLKDLLAVNQEHQAHIYEDDEEEWPKVISKADDFTVEMDEDEQVYLKTRGGKILAKMPYVIWTQLARS